jgi:hypothetical protein
MTDGHSRRRALRWLGAGLTVAVAGCSGGGDETTTDDGPDGNGDSDSTAGENGGTETADGNGDTKTPGGSSGDTKPFTLTFLGGTDNFETLEVSVNSVTFQPANDETESVTLDAGGTTVDLATLDGEESEPIIEEKPLPFGSYDTVSLDASVPTATTADGESVDVDTSNLQTSLVIQDDPATVEQSQFDANLSLYISPNASEPYELGLNGWQATGM